MEVVCGECLIVLAWEYTGCHLHYQCHLNQCLCLVSSLEQIMTAPTGQAPVVSDWSGRRGRKLHPFLRL